MGTWTQALWCSLPPRNSQTETTLEPLSRTEGLCRPRLQVWIATCRVMAKHLGMRAAVPRCLSGSGGRMRGTGGAGHESPRCSAAQHHDSVAATEPTGRQAGGPMRSLEAGKGGGGRGEWSLQLLGQAAWTSLSLGHRWADTSMPGGHPQVGFPLAAHMKLGGGGARLPRPSDEEGEAGRHGERAFLALWPPCRSPPPRRPPDRLPGPIC